VTARALGAAATLLLLVACGKVGPPVAPQLREPLPVSELNAVAGDGLIELSWTNPTRRVDGTVIRDLAVAHVFRVDDAGTGEPKSALRSRGRIAGYEEIASVPMAAPAPATVDGSRVALPDRQGLTYGRRYTYVVLVEDKEGRVSPPSTRLSVTYIAPPGPPQDVEATPGEGEVRLRWDRPAQLVDGNPVTGTLSYEVLRAAGAEGTPEPITPSPVSGTTFVDRGLVNDQTYTYAVRALRADEGGSARGAPSARITATPVDVTPPAPPRDLVAIAAAGDVRLSWTASPDPDVARYVVYRADPRGTFTRVGSIAAPATTLVDRGVAPASYRYVVTAQDGSSRANESAHSNEASVSVP
jgi:hypothetical protein